MGNPLDQNPTKEYAVLVTLTWHTTTARYTDRAEDLVIGAETFTAVPSLEITLPTFSGEAEYEPAYIYLPSTMPPADLLKRPYPSPVVAVLIEEVDPNDTSTRRKLFRGTIIRVRKNPGGVINSIKAEIAGPKYSIENGLLGLMAQTTCPWTLGDRYCGIDLAAAAVTTTISDVDGVTLSISGANPAGEKHYHRGRIVKDGISIMIRDASNNTLVLAKLPPPEWTAGSTVSVFPGCDKTLTTCRNRWNNELHFCGCGYAMPGYSPNIQVEA